MHLQALATPTETHLFLVRLFWFGRVQYVDFLSLPLFVQKHQLSLLHLGLGSSAEQRRTPEDCGSKPLEHRSAAPSVRAGDVVARLFWLAACLWSCRPTLVEKAKGAAGGGTGDLADPTPTKLCNEFKKGLS